MADPVYETIWQYLLTIPGSVFSGRGRHLRIRHAAEDRTTDRGIEIQRRLACR